MARLTMAQMIASARWPHPTIQARSYNNQDKINSVHYGETQDILLRQSCRVRGDTDTALLTSDGTSGSTVAIYRMDMAAGDVLLGGLLGRFAAQTDTVLIGAGAWAKSYKLDGTAAVVLTADGKTYDCAIVCVDINGTPTLYAVFGDEAADGAEVAPTADQISTALLAAAPANLNSTVGMIVARIKIQRVAVDTITMTHTAAASTTSLALERSYGSIFGTTS